MARPNPDFRARLVEGPTEFIFDNQNYPLDLCGDELQAILSIGSGQNALALGAESPAARISLGMARYQGGAIVNPTNAGSIDVFCGAQITGFTDSVSLVRDEQIYVYSDIDPHYRPLAAVTDSSPDDLTVAWQTAAEEQTTYFVAAFGGANVTAQGFTQTIGAAPVTVNVGFRPDVVFVITDNDNQAAAFGNGFKFSYGIATSDGTQYAAAQAEPYLAAPGQPAQCVRRDCVAMRQDQGAATIGYKVVAGNFTPNAFDLIPSADTGTDIFKILALQFNGPTLPKLFEISTPIAAGNDAIAIGFQPQMAIMVGSSMEVWNTSIHADPLAGGIQFSCFEDAGGGIKEWAASMRMKNGANPIDCASRMVAQSLSIPSDSASDVIVANLVSTSGAGFTLDYTSVAGTAKIGFGLAIPFTNPACNVGPPPGSGTRAFILGDVA